MKHVTIPTNTLGGAKKLTDDQRNDGRLPDMEEAQSAFERMFDALCTAVLDKFTEKSTKN